MKTIWKFAAIAAASFLLAHPARVGAISQISALHCQTAYNEGSTQYTEDGRIWNTSTTWWRTALCPIDSVTYVGAHPVVEVDVYVIDNNPTLDVQCRVVSTVNAPGASFFTFGPWWITSGSSPNKQALKFSTATQTLPYGDSNIHHLWCYLPQASQGQLSGIAGYSSLSMNGFYQ